MLVHFAAKLPEMKSFGKYFLNFTGFVALCCPFYLPQPGQSEDCERCAVSKPSYETGCLILTLNALINVSKNGPAKLNYESALVIVQKWTKVKNRRRVTERAIKTLEFADDEEETDAFTNEQGLFNKVEIEKFVL